MIIIRIKININFFSKIKWHFTMNQKEEEEKQNLTYSNSE